ncbi:lysophospholipid acyltransferase family protein [Nonlabens xiamenensis]|uniref:lysophospholipid acyltransferase family protein n=1 Tax=Nonlabens xiamenensis TaxID=2341043 RepID=UPI000F60EFEB|nr:lysophospholipid acyltransferase family protein [Nonlabens xiamenensis]
MQKILAYPLTVIHFVVFFGLLLVFHPIQLLCHRLGGYEPHRRSVNILNWCLMQSQLPLFNWFSVTFKQELPVGPSYIFVSNHQSMFDIPPLIWHLRKYHAKFIAKKELAKGLPSISLNLRIGENCAIDRRDSRQAVSALMAFAKNVQAKKRSAVIFAEGSRSRTGVPKEFKARGLLTLFKYIPEAVVVPITINNSWKIDRYGKFPYGIGNNIHLTIHEPIPIIDRDPMEVIQQAQTIVHSSVKNTVL